MARVLTALFITLITTTTYAQSPSRGWVNVEMTVNKDKTAPMSQASWSKGLWGPIGISSFILASPTWGEIYAGPTYTPYLVLDQEKRPTRMIQIALSAGAKMAGGTSYARFGGKVIWKHDDFTLPAVVEWGVLGTQEVWYKFLPTYAVTEWLQLGLELRRLTGLGPHVAVTVPHTPVKIWASWLPIEPEGLDGSYVHLERTVLGAMISY